MADTARVVDEGETEEIFLPAAASDSEKTKERIREWVDEAWKSSWSCGDRMRRVGFVNSRLEAWSGGGNGGVSGIGRGFCEGKGRVRGFS